MSLSRNLVSMYVWQGVNYAVPLITLPYLARVLEPQTFGVMGFAAATVAYASLVVDWGFSLSATHKVAVERDNPAALARIAWNTFAAKAMLALASFGVLLALIAAVPMLREHAGLLLVTATGLVGNVMAADWFLQGVERMDRLAAASLVGRFVPIPFIFLLVHSPADVGIAALLQALGGIATGLLSFRLAWRTGLIRGVPLSAREAIAAIRGGATLFLSVASMSLYSNLNTLLVFAIAGPMEGGLFVGADKLRRAAQALIGPISLVMYPRIANTVSRSSAAGIVLIRRLLLVQGGFALALAIATWITAPLVVRILLGPDFVAATDVLRAFAPALFLVGINNVLGIQTMLPFGFRREFLISILVPGALGLLYMPVLAWQYGAVGVAAALSTTELLVNVVAGWCLYRRLGDMRHPAAAAQAMT